MGLFSKKKKETEVAPVVIMEKSVTVTESAFEGIDPQVVAAITAAVYSMMGNAGSNSTFVVRNIVRVNDQTPIWGRVSRRDVMASRF